MATTTTLSDAARRELQGFEGELIGPEDSGYDEARAVYNAMIDRYPGLIARCTSAADVAAVVGFARNHDALLAVRGGGHNGGGLGVVDDGVVIDLSPIREIEVDAAAGTVRVGGGCTWTEVDAATHEVGMAVPCGVIGSTGVGGLTLGGGIGNLSRAYGLTVDSLLEADMVLADGSIVTASAKSHSDLHWAIRGGGGNFGVVTSFVFRMHPVRTVVAGPTFWSLEDAPAVMRHYREFIPTAPRELNCWFGFFTIPPVPLFPEALHGRKVCGLVWTHIAPERAEADMAPMLEVAEPLLHGAQEMPFPAIQGVFDPLYPKGLQWYWRADFVRELPDAAIARHVENAELMPPGHSTMHMYPIDGAVHDVDASDTAFSQRDAGWAQVIVGVDPDPANAASITRWTKDYWEATHPYSAGGAYVNFMMDEGESRIRASYRDNYDRLARIKTVYDPDNLFRVNQNIRPAA